MPFIINIIMEINISSKVYSKRLLKGSVVYSLILDYQFCACVIRVSGVQQLQVIHMERLYGLPLLYWHRNLGKSGQSWNYKNHVRL